MPHQETSVQQVEQDTPMTGPQRAYLKDLCKQSGEEFYEELTKKQASAKIDKLVRERKPQKA